MSNNANKSSLLRIVIPFAAVMLGLLVVLSLMSPPRGQDQDNDPDNAKPAQAEPADTTAKTPADSTTPAAGDTDPPAEPTTPTGQATTSDDQPQDTHSTTASTPGPLSDLRPLFSANPASLDEPTDLIPLGSNKPDSAYELFAQINPYRASIHRVYLPKVKAKVDSDEPYLLLEPVSYDLGEANYPEIGSYAARTITINGSAVALARQDPQTRQWFGGWNVQPSTQDAVILSLTIQGGPQDAPVDVLRITRTFRIAPGSNTIELDQRIENLTDQTLKVQWEQLAQGDVHHETNDYLRGRSLHYVTGYFKEKYDPDHFSIYVDDGFIARPDLIGDLKYGKTDNWQSIWPNPQVKREDKLLAWLASENRYFVVISSADTEPTIEETADVPALEAVYPTITTTIYPDAAADEDLADEKRRVFIGFTSRQLTLEPGKTSSKADLSLDLFAGPREKAVFDKAPYQALRFEKTVRYSLGGFCGFCTFQWLAHLLLGFLELLHAVVFDWGIAIIILVLVVRLLLHPITKRGQINMMKMGKQMAAIQPELEKLKKKYAEDPRQMQQAQMQLFREKGVNPAAGALGCLPMFLQMPIWIALYAMLYYASELRHESAFYGVFQAINGWPFLADLSSADRFIPLLPDDGKSIANLWLIQFDYSAINLLPILMGVTFYFNMKFTTPPPMNEQQATQQKIMKIMPLIFPFFLYSAPAGLTLYICASTFAGIIDSAIVRKHVKALEASGELFKPKERKPGGFMDKLHKAAEMRAKQLEERKNQQDPNRGPQNYKKRKR